MTNPSLKLAKWPQNDRSAWQVATVDGGILDERGSAAHWAAATRATNIHHYGRFLAFLDEQNTLDSSLNPANRCTPENIRAYVEKLKTNVAPVTVASSLIGLSVMAKAMVPEEDWSWLARICNILKRNAKPRRDKRLRILPSARIYTASLGDLERLSATNLSTRAQLVGFRNALMLGMLTAAPIRLKNFAALLPGSTLIKRGCTWLVTAHESAVKNKTSITLELPEELASFVDTYLALVRPRLLGKNISEALWLNWYGKGMTEHAIYLRFVKFTPRLLGRPINPHLLRDCAATTLATNSSGAAMAARGLLGHKRLSTTEKYYIHAQQLEASRQINGLLTRIKAAETEERGLA